MMMMEEKLGTEKSRRERDVSYVLSYEVGVLMDDAPRSNADCDDVVTSLNDCVTKSITNVYQ